MTESAFVDILYKELNKKISGYTIEKKKNLIYKVIVTHDGRFKPESPDVCKRGQLSFQTDLLIGKKDNNVWLPLVVIEAKVKGFSTHDVITYSSKAVKHKEVYPYLRYGLVVAGPKVITNKFFTHNYGFDFAIAIDDTEDLSPFIKLIKSQIQNSEKLLKILKDENKTWLYSENIEAEKIQTR